MPETLYDVDCLAWAEQQADLLRRVAAGERLNAAVDWPHVIEEVRDLGLSELRACQSLLQQAMTHLLKLAAWTDHRAAPHWREETGTFLDDATRRFTGSMRQRSGLDQLYASARCRAEGAREDFGDRARFSRDLSVRSRRVAEGRHQGLLAALGSRSPTPP